MNIHEKIKHWEENERIDTLKSIDLKPGDYLLDEILKLRSHDSQGLKKE